MRCTTFDFMSGYSVRVILRNIIIRINELPEKGGRDSARDREKNGGREIDREREIEEEGEGEITRGE